MNQETKKNMVMELAYDIHAKFQYQYYHLRKYGRVKEFLKYFPEMGNELEKYRKQKSKLL